MAKLLVILMLACAALIIAGVALAILLFVQNKRMDKVADKTRKLAEAMEQDVREDDSQEDK